MTFKSTQILIIGYIGFILLGAFVLLLPCMHTGSLSFFEALFTSTSAFTCTGLIIKDSGLDFTPLGQGVILSLIWLGGFGYMSMLGIVYILLRKKLSNKEKNLIKESLNYPTYEGMIGFIRKVLYFVLAIELIGGVSLGAYFYIAQDFSPTHALWAGVFHAISAFNNAGFSLFSQNLVPYRQSLALNLIICTLIIAGGLGYIVLVEIHLFGKAYGQKALYVLRSFKRVPRSWVQIQRELGRFNPPKILSLHTKIVLSFTLALLALGFGFVLLLEYHNPKSLGDFTLGDKLLTSFFISVNYRTAGFNTIDLSSLKDSTLFFSSILMSIGGAPGGSAGGIKVTTLAVLFAFYVGLLYDRQPRLFGRQIAERSVKKAIGVGIIALVSVIVATFIIAAFQDDVRFMLILFEVCSAFATSGVSSGNGDTLSLSANFNPIAQSVIIALMIMGKVGILAFWLAFVMKRKNSHITLQEERVII